LRPPPTSPCEIRAVLAAMAGTILLASVMPVLAVLPREGQPVAIISERAGAPALLAALGEAGGRVTGLAGSHVTIAVPGDARFSSRLRERGYWLLMDAGTLAACLPALQSSRRT
jgi:hypothetical protein